MAEDARQDLSRARQTVGQRSQRSACSLPCGIGFRVARLLAGLQVSCIFWDWVVSQCPFLAPPELTIHKAAAPEITLRITLWTLAGGALVLAPSLLYLFRVFKSGESHPL
jgi:cytochrome bd-type quinol oxidase subunit 2